MPTEQQLRAEQWWGREIVTPELDWLGDELCRRTGRPRTAAGTKGDEHHLRGAHRSQEWIKNSRYCTNRTYTTQSGLTSAQMRHVAGLDFNPGPTEAMRSQTKRLIDAMRAGRLDEVREVYGTADGRTVTGWNNAENRYATSDSSHLWHWHISIDRRRCADRALMERILRIVLGEDEGDDDMTDEDRQKLNALYSLAFSGGPSCGTEAAPANGRPKSNSLVQKLDRLLEQATADAQRDADLAELVRQGQSGERDAAEVVRLIGERLVATGGTTGTGSA